MQEKSGATYAIGRELFDRKLRTQHLLRRGRGPALQVRRAAARRGHRRARAPRRGAEAGRRPGAQLVEQLREDRPARDGALRRVHGGDAARARVHAREGIRQRPRCGARRDRDAGIPAHPRAVRGVPGAGRVRRRCSAGPSSSPCRPPASPGAPTAAPSSRAPPCTRDSRDIICRSPPANSLKRRVRRVLATPASREGWALYCETLMAEEGFLDSGAALLPGAPPALAGAPHPPRRLTAHPGDDMARSIARAPGRTRLRPAARRRGGAALLRLSRPTSSATPSAGGTSSSSARMRSG